MATSRDEYLGDPVIMYVIRSTAQKIADTLHIPSYNAKDAEQDLHVDLLLRTPFHDAAKSNLRTFATRIIRNRGVTIIKHNRAGKRGPGASFHVSLDASGDPDRGVHLTNHERISSSDFPDWAMQRAVDIRDVDLSIDMRRVLDRLPTRRLRETADALEAGGAAAAAEELGVHRSVVYDRRAEIRRRLERTGLGEYLEE